MDQLEFEIARGRFAPVYLFLGTEEYLVRHALATIKEKAVAPDAQSFNLALYSARDTGAARIVSEANTFPISSPRRLVLVTELEGLASEDHDPLLAYVASPQSKTVLVLVAAELDRRTTFYKRLANSACVVEFVKLKGPALEKWTGSLISRNGYRITPGALKRLVDLAGSDMLTLAGEIEKLILYAGKEKQIQDSALDLLVPATRQRGIFELTGAIGKRDQKNALKILGNLLEAGEPALVILSMMARHFRQTIIAKELLSAGRNQREIGRAAQVPDFLLAEFLRQVQAIDLDVARKLYQRLGRIDLRFKSSGSDERMILEQLICSL